MKRSKAEIFLQIMIEFLSYLDRHKIQGRILFTGVSILLVLLGLKFSTNELAIIIEAFK